MCIRDILADEPSLRGCRQPQALHVKVSAALPFTGDQGVPSALTDLQEQQMQFSNWSGSFDQELAQVQATGFFYQYSELEGLKKGPKNSNFSFLFCFFLRQGFPEEL